VTIDGPNITMEEYIRLEEEKARRHVFNDTLTSEAPLSYKPTVSSINNDEIDFRISFDESDDEDYTPTVSCFDDLDFFKYFENEFPANVYVTPPDGAWTEYVSGGMTLLSISRQKHKERPLRTLDLTVHNLDRFFNEIQFVVNLDLIQWFSSYIGIALLTITGGLDMALDLNYSLGCLVVILWASEVDCPRNLLSNRLFSSPFISSPVDGSDRTLAPIQRSNEEQL
ncbi:hypothetical protein Tco_0089210, partial [Tanacetum coccineum]